MMLRISISMFLIVLVLMAAMTSVSATNGPNGQSDYWAMIQSRTFYASTSGTYTFQTKSADGSWLYVDGKQVVNNSGTHSSPTTATGTISLVQGYHWVYVKFFDWTDLAYMAYQYQPPGSTMQTIPDNHALKGNALVYSLDTANSSTSSSDFTQIVPLSYQGSFGWNGVEKDYGNSGPLSIANNWIVMQPFVFWVATNGSYSFKTTSKDGSWIWIDGQVVVNNSGLHSSKTTVTGSVSLVRGWHVGFMKFFCGSSGNGTIYAAWLPPSRGGGAIYDPIPVY